MSETIDSRANTERRLRALQKPIKLIVVVTELFCIIKEPSFYRISYKVPNELWTPGLSFPHNQELQGFKTSV